jgi:hypothetical protein
LRETPENHARILREIPANRGDLYELESRSLSRPVIQCPSSSRNKAYSYRAARNRSGKGAQGMVEFMNNRRMFPCPVCAGPREVRITKKKKPYVTCDPCGIQLFVRGATGIDHFNRLVDNAEREDVFARFAEIERRYYVLCPACPVAAASGSSQNWPRPASLTEAFEAFAAPPKTAGRSSRGRETNENNDSRFRLGLCCRDFADMVFSVPHRCKGPDESERSGYEHTPVKEGVGS